MSLKAFKKNRGKLPEEAKRIIAHRLYRAAKRYDVDTDPHLESIVSHTSSVGHVYPLTGEMVMALYDAGPSEEDMPKAASFGIDRNIYGDEMKKFAIDTPKQWHRQAENFEKKAYQWFTTYSIQMAKNLQKRAYELGIDIPLDSKIPQFADDTLSKVAWANIDARMKKLEDRGDEEASWEYAELRDKIGSVSPRQLAITTEELDRKHRLHFYWSSRAGNRAGLFHHPVDALLMKRSKVASVIDIEGLMVDLAKLSDLLENNEEIFATHLDQTTLEKLKDSPEEALKTMPLPQREVVMDILRRTS